MVVPGRIERLTSCFSDTCAHQLHQGTEIGGQVGDRTLVGRLSSACSTIELHALILSYVHGHCHGTDRVRDPGRQVRAALTHLDLPIDVHRDPHGYVGRVEGGHVAVTGLGLKLHLTLALGAGEQHAIEQTHSHPPS